MENQQPQPSKPTNKALWIVLVIVILAIVGYGIYTYVSGRGNENTNNVNTTINQNTNVTANSNTGLSTNTAVNTNTVANTNTAVNTNTSTNTNTVDTTGWKTYKDQEYNYTLEYPKEWTYERIYLTKDPTNTFPVPIRYLIFYSPNKEYHLVIGIKKKGDAGSIYYRTGIGAGEIKSGNKVLIADKTFDTWKLVYQEKVQEVFFYPVTTSITFVDILNYEVSANFGPDQINSATFNNLKLLETTSYLQALRILQSLSLVQ
jgi:hypothetical protein